MAGFSDYLINKVLNHVFGSTTFTKPTGLKVHLYNGDPHGAGTEISAVVDDTAYAAQSVAFEDEGTTTNNRNYTTGTVTFAAVVYGSGAAPYSVTHAAIKDGSGNLLDAGPLPATITRNVGEPLVFNAASIFVSLART